MAIFLRLLTLKRHFRAAWALFLGIALVALPAPFVRGQSSIVPSEDDIPPVPTHDVPQQSAGYAISSSPPEAVLPDQVQYPDPAAAVVHPHVVDVTLTPGTLRQGYTYHDEAKALVRLSVAVAKPLILQVTSSAGDEIAGANILFEKGEREKSCGLVVNWKKVTRDDSVLIRVVDPARPERVVQARLYLIRQVL